MIVMVTTHLVRACTGGAGGHPGGMNMDDIFSQFGDIFGDDNVFGNFFGGGGRRGGGGGTSRPKWTKRQQSSYQN